MLRLFSIALSFIVFATAAATSSGPVLRDDRASEAVRTALLWWSAWAPDTRFQDLPSEVQNSLKQFNATAAGFQSRMRGPSTKDFALQSVFRKKQALERTVVALFGHDAAAEASRFATFVSPAYEWEGFSGGPLGELAGAEHYLAEQPTTRIRPYALLVIAHRAACASDALHYELREGVGDRNWNLARQSRVQSRFQQAAAEASFSTHPLIQFVAQDLSRNPRCL